VAVPRRRREWVSDGMLFALALLVWWYFGFVASSTYDGIPDWFWPVDRALGLLACGLIWWTRRYPRAVAILLIVPGALAVSAGFAALVGVHRVGRLARPSSSLTITAAHIAFALPYHALFPLPDMPWVVWLVVIPLLYALAVSLGLLSRSRRQVIDGLRASAAVERERYEERLLMAARDERERIAREMHDVLAHRISLLSVHAGALEYRTRSDAPGGRTATAEEVHETAVVIRESAHRAVEELRDLLTVLREGDGVDPSLAAGRPQPRLGDIESLVAEATAAGEEIEVSVDVTPDAVRESTQRTVYRGVQEGLTNARKHAPGARVSVVVESAGDIVRLEVSNPVAVGVTADEIPGAGRGLLGLAERVRIEGGRMDAGVRDGRFRLAVELPAGAR
jgi:signal transduction histidine kinase